MYRAIHTACLPKDKGKGKGDRLLKYHTMKTNEGVELQLHVF
jgi:hypothetical protein